MYAQWQKSSVGLDIHQTVLVIICIINHDTDEIIDSNKHNFDKSDIFIGLFDVEVVSAAGFDDDDSIGCARIDCFKNTLETMQYKGMHCETKNITRNIIEMIRATITATDSSIVC